jgi:hypothetical protein
MSKNIPWSDLCFHKYLNEQITHIYNVMDRPSTYSPVPDSIDSTSAKLLSEEHRKIVNIEKNNGRKINTSQAQGILSLIMIMHTS